MVVVLGGCSGNASNETPLVVTPEMTTRDRDGAMIAEGRTREGLIRDKAVEEHLTSQKKQAEQE